MESDIPARLGSSGRAFSLRIRQIGQFIFDLVLGLAALATAALAPLHTRILFSDAFNYPEGLVTDEFAFFNLGDPRAVTSSLWDVTSGALFAVEGVGWTGAPNAGATKSAIFRLVTKQDDFEDVEVSFDLLNQGLSSTRLTPPVDWDGVHVFLRYQSHYSLYYISVNRRDDTVIVKKKVPGGPSNGGTYHNLSAHADYTVPYGEWQRVRATVKNNQDGSVTMQLFINDIPLLGATDTGIGGPPIRRRGRTGLRGDNADIKFTNFVVRDLKGD